MRLYLDSNVFISSARSEIDYSFNLRFKDSDDFFSLCRTQKIELVISNLFLLEIKRKIFFEKNYLIDYFDSAGIQIILVEANEKQKALEISNKTGIHFSDALHAATAIKHNCNAIITWNKKDFEKTKELIPCFTPKEFIQKDS